MGEGWRERADTVRELVVGAGARLIGFVGARLGRADLAARFALPPDCHGVWIDRRAVVAASRGAAAAFGEAAAPGAPVVGLGTALGGPDGEAAAALSRLAEGGTPFRLRARDAAGRRWELAGGPRGALAVVTLRDVTADADETAAMARDLSAARREIEALRLALSAGELFAWRLDRTGAERWRSTAAAERAPPPDCARFDLGEDGALLLEQRDEARDAVALRDFIQTVGDALATLRTGLAIFDGGRRLVLSNPALGDLFHLDAAWLGGRPSLRDTLDRLRAARQLPEQADFPAWRAALLTLFDGPDGALYDERWDLPDGRAIQVCGRPHPRGGIAFTFDDVTQSAALQRDASMTREVQRAALELVDDGVILFGLDGRTRFVNAAFRNLWGVGQRDGAPLHVGEVAEACCDLAGPAAPWEQIRVAVAGGRGRAPLRQRARLTDGRVVDFRVAPLRDGATIVVCCVQDRAGVAAESATSAEGAVDAAGGRRAVQGGDR